MQQVIFCSEAIGGDLIQRRKPEIRVNGRIRVPEVRVIDEAGEQIGVMQTREALDLAYSRGLDLVEISPNATPPVCKILDSGRYKYELQKKSRVSKKKQHQVSLKEMRFRPKIDEHDYQFKARHVIDFLQSGHKVKLFVEFRGREMAHQEYGAKILERLAQDLALIAIVEVPANMEGHTMTMVVTPKGKKTGQGIHDAQDEDEPSSREEISENR